MCDINADAILRSQRGSCEKVVSLMVGNLN